jgi:cytochrome c oxidase cbb3-type subunit 2
MKIRYQYFEAIEKRVWLLGLLTALFVSFGGLAEIVPLFVAANSVKVPADVKPYSPLRLAGFEVYVHNGCYLCHSQMIRRLGFETKRYGPVSTAVESVYDRPMQWGSKRTGPDLSRVGGKYSDAWQYAHLMNPRSVVPESNMPDFAFLAKEPIDVADLQGVMRARKLLGEPYTDADISKVPEEVKDKTKLDALVAYLQGLGIDNEPGGVAPKQQPASEFYKP